MTGRPIDFYFEFASPYGYLASHRIEAVAARHDRQVRWLPLMLGAAFKRTGSQPLMHVPMKGPYLLRDVTRMARLWKIPFTAPPAEAMPMNSLAASRAFLWQEQGDGAKAVALAKAVYQAHFGEGRAMSGPAPVAAVAETIGIDPLALTEAIKAREVKDRLKERTEEAIARGVFGSPFVFVDDEPFWGADRLDQVDQWLETGGW